jgi:hypothetical protein
MDINAVYLWTVGAVSVVAALGTIWKLFVERDRLIRDDLYEEDRSLAWRVVFFLVFPLVTLIDLRSTTVACNLVGGHVSEWGYGFSWYHIITQGVPDQFLIPVLFAGPIATTILALLLIPALAFKPHPFLACVLGYSCVFILTLNLIINPVLALAGFGASHWSQALTQGSIAQLATLTSVHIILAVTFIVCASSSPARLWFSELTRPSASRDLKEALSVWHGHPDSAKLFCRLGILYHQAGLRRQARQRLKLAREKYPESLYTIFLEALMSYKARQYALSRTLFEEAADDRRVDGELKASFFAAAGCGAFAEGDVIGALNLSERALEFDNNCVVARMVKVDVFLKQGKKELAGDEIVHAMRLGLSLELDGKIPLDADEAFLDVATVEERETVRNMVEMNS